VAVKFGVGAALFSTLIYWLAVSRWRAAEDRQAEDSTVRAFRAL
jgi:hypothetical protein